MKRKTKIYLTGTILLLCTCVGSFLYIDSSLFIRNHILPLISEEIGETVDVNRISFSLLSGFKLENVRVGAHKPILTIQTVEVNYQMRPLLDGKLQVDLLDIQNVKIDCEKERGLLIVNRILKRLVSEAPKLNVSELRISAPEVRIHGEHQGRSSTLTFNNLNIEGTDIGNQEAFTLDVTAGGQIEIQNERVEIHPTTLQVKGSLDDNFRLPNLTAKGRLDCSTGTLMDIDLSNHAVVFELAGSFLNDSIRIEKFSTEVTHDTERLLELESSATIPFPSLSPIKLTTVIPHPINLNDLLDYWQPVDRSTLSSTPERAPLPNTMIILQAKQVEYNKLSATEVDIRLRTVGTKAIIDQSTCTLNGAPVQFSADLDLGRPDGIHYTLKGSGNRLPLHTLSDLFPAFGKGVPLRVEGIIQSGEVELSGRFVDFKTLLANMRGKTGFELGPCRVAEFKGPYKKAFEMLMRAYVYTLKTEDLKFSDGHGRLSFEGCKLSFEELKLNSEQIGVRFHGDVTLGEEKIIPDIYLQANLSKENTNRIGRFIYVQPQPDGRSLTNEIRLAGDIEKLSTMAVIIATFVVKPEYREMTETVLTTGFDKASDLGTLLKGIGGKLGLGSDEPEQKSDE